MSSPNESTVTGPKEGTVVTSPNGSTLRRPRNSTQSDNSTRADDSTSSSPKQLTATVITVSNEISAGLVDDRAGVLAVDLLAEAGVEASRVVVPDDTKRIVDAVRHAVAARSRVVLTCGGTGIGPSDLTAAAVAPLLAFEVPGICEEIRRRGREHVASAIISREVAGVIRESATSAFVLTAPGSRGGVRDAIAVVGPLLDYIVGQLDAVGHR